MSKAQPLEGCLAMDHDEVDCEAAGVQDPELRCAPCWAQSAATWNPDLARALVRRSMIMDASDETDEEEQIQAGVAWLQELFTERHKEDHA